MAAKSTAGLSGGTVFTGKLGAEFVIAELAVILRAELLAKRGRHCDSRAYCVVVIVISSDGGRQSVVVVVHSDVIRIQMHQQHLHHLFDNKNKNRNNKLGLETKTIVLLYVTISNTNTAYFTMNTFRKNI